VIGMGNRVRGDDAAGLAVADGLRSTESLALQGDPTSAIDRWCDFDRVVLVDATRSGRTPGAITRLSRSEITTVSPGPPRFAGTHSIGPVELIRLAEVLGVLPATIEVIGIEAESFAHGAALSRPVSESVARMIEELDHA